MKRRALIFILTAIMSTAVGLCACGDNDRDDNSLPPIVDNTGGNTDNTGGDNNNVGGDNNTTGNDENTGGDDNSGGDDNTGGDENTGGNTGDTTNDTRTPTSNTMKTTKTTVYYNSKWNKVYAYLWNSKTPDSPKKKWPGDLLTASGTNDYGESQYSVVVDYSQYDRIIFNDGNKNQTKDLIVSSAVSGYYGTDGVFTEGVSDYGKVTEKTLKDTKNLSYIGNKSKKIWVYTPPDYSKTKKYGVLYMFDGQNAFGAASGVKENSGAWLVDVAVTNLVKNGGDGVIVVGIDNGSGGSDQRDQELTMSQSFGTITSLGAPQYGYFTNGKLDELGNFIKETVMPWVKANYSVDDSREKTGIVGSSSGGLGSYYLGLRDNDLYGYIGAFSPANGIFTASDWTRFYKSKSFGSGNRPKIYVYCGRGDKDLEDMLLPETQRIKNLTSYGYKASEIIENYVDGGTHNEAYWRVAFAEFAGKLIP